MTYGKVEVTQEVADKIEKHKSRDVGMWVYDTIGRTSTNFMRKNNITNTELVQAIEHGYTIKVEIEVGDIVKFKANSEYHYREVVKIFDKDYEFSNNGSWDKNKCILVTKKENRLDLLKGDK